MDVVDPNKPGLGAAADDNPNAVDVAGVAPNNDGVDAAPNNDGVDAAAKDGVEAPKRDGVDAAPNRLGLEVAPNMPGADEAAPKPGALPGVASALLDAPKAENPKADELAAVLAAPKAGAEDAPKAAAEDAPKRGVEAAAPKAGADPNENPVAMLPP